MQIYVLLPLVLYVAERVWRLLRNVAFNGELLDVELLPGSGKKPKPSGSVTVLRMHKPRDFSYRRESPCCLPCRCCLFDCLVGGCSPSRFLSLRLS